MSNKLLSGDAGRPRFVPRLLLFGVLALLPSCDFSVANPGPLQDTDLDDPAAAVPLLNSAHAALSSALWRVTFVGAEVAREYVQGGRIFTTKLPSTPGQLTRESVSSAFWDYSVRARWVAEDVVRRFRANRSDFDTAPIAAQALIYAGFANRLLGENFCEAVIDGGPAQPGSIYFERAEQHFTEALAIATAAGRQDLVHAARAGRATIRVHLDDWTGAVADAGLVPADFVLQAEYHTTELEQFNQIYWTNANQPFRTHSVVGTFFEDYYRQTGDPRVAWGQDPEVPNAEIASVPWLFQLKYRSREDDINLVTGRELRLIEAEALLRDGDGPGAVVILNALRSTLLNDHTGAPLELYPAPADLTEAWTYLKRERAIELWLEGRRLADLRRWIADNTPGEMEDMSDRIRLCFPIAQSELNTNPNLDLQHADPVNPAYVQP